MEIKKAAAILKLENRMEVGDDKHPPPWKNTGACEIIYFRERIVYELNK
jgi:hypothetical protein